MVTMAIRQEWVRSKSCVKYNVQPNAYMILMLKEKRELNSGLDVTNLTESTSLFVGTVNNVGEIINPDAVLLSVASSSEYSHLTRQALQR